MSTGNVSSITSHARTIRKYLHKLFDNQEGYVYVASKTRQREFSQEFFQWPAQSEDIVTWLIQTSFDNDVYVSPSLFRAPSSNKEDWHGTHYVWAEFDYGIPTIEELNSYNIPMPTIRIKTSDDGHEHWYWQLDQFVQDKSVIESITSRLTYAFKADLSGWDCNQLLRPPKTKHHESGKETQLLIWNNNRVNPLIFNDLPPVAKDVEEIEVDTSKPIDVTDIMLKYPFNDDMRELFRKKVERGRRNEAMCKLACYCLEAGMSTAEAYAILLNVDDRWGKYVGRKDREKRLIGILKYAKTKVTPVADDNEWAEWGGKLPVYNVLDFLAQDIKVEWIIDNFIPKNGIMVIAGPSEVGKTIETLQLCIDMALGRKHHIWDITRPFKVVFLSMEFGRDVLHDRLNKMLKQIKEGVGYTEEELKLLGDNFHIVPLGHGLNIANPKDQAAILEMIQELQPDGIFLDSLGASYSGDLKDESVRHIFEFLKRAITIKYDCFAWFIHHMKKVEPETKKPTIDDMYGSVYIKNNASVVIGMWKRNREKNKITIYSLKQWFSEPFPDFHVQVALEPMRLELIESDDIEGGISFGKFNDPEDEPIGNPFAL